MPKHLPHEKRRMQSATAGTWKWDWPNEPYVGLNQRVQQVSQERGVVALQTRKRTDDGG